MQEIIAQLDSTHQQLLDTVTSVAPETFAQRPSPGEWSIAENIHHLYLTEQAVVKEMEKALAQPPQKLALLNRLIQNVIPLVAVRLVRVKAPKYVEPLNAPAKAEVISNYNSIRAKLKEVATKHGTERLANLVLKHPVFGPYDGLHALAFNGYHELRHYKQIKELMGKLK